MKPENDQELSLDSKEKKELAKQALLELIPYVGGSLSTAYYGYKQEIRFKRLEKFYKNVSDKLANRGVKLTPINDHDKNALMAIIEELNETVENEIIEEKREFLHNYFQNLLTTPTKESNYEERRSFLNALADMTFGECILLSDVKIEGRTMIKDLGLAKDHDIFVLYASVNKLESFGYLKSNQSNYVFNDSKEGEKLEDERSLKIIEVSPLGEKFIEFCIEEKV